MCDMCSFFYKITPIHSIRCVNPLPALLPHILNRNPIYRGKATRALYRFDNFRHFVYCVLL